MPDFLNALRETLKLIDWHNLIDLSTWNTDVANPPTVVLNILYGLQCVRLFWFTQERGMRTRFLFASLVTTTLFMGVIRAFFPQALPLADWVFWSLLNAAVFQTNNYLQDRLPKEKNLAVYARASHWQSYALIFCFGVLSLYCMNLYGQRNSIERSSDRKAQQASTAERKRQNDIEEKWQAWPDSLLAIQSKQATTIARQARQIADLTAQAHQRTLQLGALTQTTNKTSQDVVTIKGVITQEPHNRAVDQPKLGTVTVNTPTSTTASSSKTKPVKKKTGWLPWNWFGSRTKPEETLPLIPAAEPTGDSSLYVRSNLHYP